MRAVALAGALALLVAAPAALANQGGVAGYTGKPNAQAPQGESCNKCHNGGTTPTVTFEGPTSLAPGAQAEFKLIVATGQSRAGAGVASSAGTLAPGAGLRDSFGEMVQDNPVTVSGGRATFTFTVKAPATPGNITLWGVGLASNGAGTGGDRAAQTTREIVVGGGAPSGGAGTPTGGATGGGGSPRADAADGGASASDDDTEAEEDDTAPSAARPFRNVRQGSCAAGPTRTDAPLGIVFAFALGVIVRRMRRRR